MSGGRGRDALPFRSEYGIVSGAVGSGDVGDGYYQAEILTALAKTVVLFFISGFILYEACSGSGNP